MSCRFCQQTKLSKACPMCGSTAQAESPAPAPARGPTPLPSVISAIRKAYVRGEKYTAAVLIVGLSKGPSSKYDIQLLVDADRNAAARGHVNEAELAERTAIVERACKVLGFNPLKQDGPGDPPRPSPPRPAATHIIADKPFQPIPSLAPKQLDEGHAAPLRAGDWAGLYQRVKAGSITEEQAIEFGQLWSKLG